MHRRGFTLVEALVALGLFGLLLGGGMMLLRGVGARSTSERQAILAGENARRAVEGLSRELSGAQAALILPGADERGVGLVALLRPDWAPLREGWSQNAVLIQAPQPPSFPGGAVLLAPTGEAFYSPVATVSTVDPARGIQEVLFPNCSNPLYPTEGTRLYPARALSLAWDGSTLSFRGGDGTSEGVVVQDFRFRYVYTDGAGGETAQSSFRGASYSDGGTSWKLRYLGLYAAGGSGETVRSATLRIPLLGGVTRTLLCDSTPTRAAGTGAVGIVIQGAPLGDVTLEASGGYRKTTSSSVVYTGVPVGPFTVTARPVSRGLYSWLPGGQNPWTHEGTVNTFAPVRVVVDYRLVQGQIQVKPVTLPDGSPAQNLAGQLRWAGDEWSPAQTVDFTEAGGEWTVPPGRYELSIPGWEVVNATPTSPLAVASGGRVSLELVVRPGPLLLQLSVLREGADNGLAPLVCIWPDPGGDLIPQDAEVNACPTNP